MSSFFFFFNDTATTEIYTLSLHDALPISWSSTMRAGWWRRSSVPTSRSIHRQDGWSTTPSRSGGAAARPMGSCSTHRSEEHTSELQSLAYLVCRLLLEKKT